MVPSPRAISPALKISAPERSELGCPSQRHILHLHLLNLRKWKRMVVCEWEPGRFDLRDFSLEVCGAVVGPVLLPVPLDLRTVTQCKLLPRSSPTSLACAARFRGGINRRIALRRFGDVSALVPSDINEKPAL